jgi:hypothetical protein
MFRPHIIRYYSIFLLFIWSFTYQLAHAQQSAKVILNGKVTDEKSGKPLPFANVFINNSTIGTTADENGNYRLGNLDMGTLDIGVSYLGYGTIRQTIRVEQPGLKTIQFKLKEGTELMGVTIYSRKNKNRERNLKIVSRELLGTNEFSKLCTITNPEVIRVHQESNGHLSAQSTSPLIIENKALGYRIYQDLDDFDYYDGKLSYSGTTRFEVLKTKDDLQKKLWKKNQKEAYQGSLKHLLASMVADSIAEQGFKVFQTIPESMRRLNPNRPVPGANPIANQINAKIKEVKGITLIQPAELETERYLVSDTKLEIFNMNKKSRSPYSDMPYAYTQVTLPQGYMVITPKGWVAMPMGFELAGDLGKDRFSSLLPADWNQEE